jgi:glutamine amidotransferase
MIGIIDYKMGNVKSVTNAVDILGEEYTIVSSPEDFRSVDHLILPGVGNFGKGMENLKNGNLIEPILSYLQQGKPFLGICVGMQLLSTVGFEGGECKGLNVVPGKVQKFEEGSNIRVPHVGWNSIKIENDPYGLFDGIANGSDFYFTHSYHFVPELKENWMCSTEYGYTFASAIQKNKIIATQFHPEKSQDKGLRFLSNFFSM